MPGSYVRIDDVTVMDPQSGLTYYMPVQLSNEERLLYETPEATATQNQGKPSTADDNETIPVPGFEIPGAKAAKELDALNQHRANAEQMDAMNPYVTPSSELINPYPGKKPVKDSTAVKKHMKNKGSVEGPRGGLPPEGNVNPYAVDLSGKDPVGAALDYKAQVAADFDTVASARQRANEVGAEISMREAGDIANLQGQAKETVDEQGRELAKKRMLRSKMADDARNEAIERIQTWEKDYEEAANAEVDNNRYWHNRSGFQKAMFMIGMAAGSLVEHIYGKNNALQILKEEIAKDIASQDDKIARKMDLMKMKRENIDQLNMLDRIRLEDFDADTEMFAKEYMLRLDSIGKAIEEKKTLYGQERIPVDLINLQAQIEQEKLQVRDALGNVYYEDATRRRDMMFQQAEAAKQRSHEWGMAKQRHTWDMEEIAAKHMAEQSGWANAINAGQQVGVWTVDEQGNKIPALILQSDKVEQMNQAQEVIQGANKTHTLLNLLKDAISDQGIAEKWVGSKDKTALLEELTISKAKSAGLAPLSDDDLNLIRATIVGAASASGTSNFKPGSVIAEIDRNIDLNIRDTTDKLHTYAKVGSQVIYEPQMMIPSREKAGGDTIDDRMAELAGKSGSKSKARRGKTKQAQVEDTETNSILLDINQLVKEGKKDELELYAQQLYEVLSTGDPDSAVYKAVNTGGGGGTDAANLAEYAMDQLEKMRHGKGAGLRTNKDKERKKALESYGVDEETADRLQRYEQGTSGSLDKDLL